jgi:hypothetical protein
LQYRLYEIDRIISRTLAYAIVTGVLLGLYAGLVLLATRVLTVTSPVAVAGSMLAAAALFSPLRRRVQRVVDRRFNRAKYNAEQTVAAFAAGCRTQSNWTACGRTCSARCTGRWSPRTRRSGSPAARQDRRLDSGARRRPHPASFSGAPSSDSHGLP